MIRNTLSALGLATLIALAGCSPPPEDQTAKDQVEAPAPVETPPAEAPKPLEPAPAPEPPRPVAAAKPRPRPVEPAPAPYTPPPPPPAPKVCNECGVVASIEPIKERGQGTGAGAVIGGVLGGVIGHQFGGGKGKDVATAAGAIGGAVAGHQVEKTVRSTTTYRINVSMETGGTQSIMVPDAGGLSVGERVKVFGNTIQPRTD